MKLSVRDECTVAYVMYQPYHVFYIIDRKYFITCPWHVVIRYITHICLHYPHTQMLSPLQATLFCVPPWPSYCVGPPPLLLPSQASRSCSATSIPGSYYSVFSGRSIFKDQQCPSICRHRGWIVEERSKQTLYYSMLEGLKLRRTLHVLITVSSKGREDS